MIVVDFSIAITALPKIQASLHFTAVELSWLQNAYTLSFGGLLLLGARAGDILGRRRMLVLGLAIFSAASLAVALGSSPAILLVARTVQGIGAAVLAPATLALLQTNFPEGPERIKAFAYYGAVTGVGGSLGLVLGGAFTAFLSWRIGFMINVPIGLLLIAATYRFLAETEHRPGKFDLSGALSSAFGMTAVVYAVIRSATTGWADLATVTALCAGIGALFYFLNHESHAEQPIIPLRLFRNTQRNAAYASRFLYLGAMMGFWFFGSQFLQIVLGFTPFAAGLAFLPATLANLAVAVAVPKMTKRGGGHALIAIGLALTLLGMWLLSHVSSSSSYLFDVALPMIFVGAGQGASMSPLTAAGVAGVPPQDAGAASGLFNVAGQMGSSLGFSIIVAVFAAAGSKASGGRVMLSHQIASAFTAESGMVLLALIVVGFLIVLPAYARIGSVLHLVEGTAKKR